MTSQHDHFVVEDFADLNEVELLALYLHVRGRLAQRLMSRHGSESIEMLLARISEAVEPPASPAIRISPREREVLHFLAQGKRNAEIAAALVISEHTVKNHVANILEKYHVQTRQAAVMAAIRDGVIEVV